MPRTEQISINPRRSNPTQRSIEMNATNVRLNKFVRRLHDMLIAERGRGVVARQELSRTYIRNGFCYVVTDVALLSEKSIFGSKLGAVICDIPFINIDSHDDLERCRAYFEDKDHGS